MRTSKSDQAANSFRVFCDSKGLCARACLSNNGGAIVAPRAVRQGPLPLTETVVKPKRPFLLLKCYIKKCVSRRG